MVMPKNEPIPAPSPIGARIYTVRDQTVMLDSDLAEVYEVATKALNQAVRRNERRFPPEFSFQLTQDEWDDLRSQIVTLKTGRGQHRKYPPRAFTENGAVALAMVLDSDRAIAASIQVVKAFVSLRRVLDTNLAFARKLDELSAKIDQHDRAFVAVFEELKRLAGDMDPEPPKEGRIGFKTNKERGVSGKARKK
jgi:hypothetical protein